MQHLATHLQRLLAYHGWAYARLLGELASLDEAQYRAPFGLFFGSIHATLNHLAVAGRTALENYLEAGVAAWRDHLEGLVDVELLAPLAYRNMAGEPQQRSRLEIVTHLVNHGTHHRGQISAALTALGRPAPVLDYIYALPELP